MDKKCENGDGELIEGNLISENSICFAVKYETKKIIPNYYSIVECGCCSVCLHIQNLRAQNPEKLRIYKK